ncbi:MAG: ribonuclease III [Clostridia bacterium]|nr:ribonuclease III [Clostridia bacterium]
MIIQKGEVDTLKPEELNGATLAYIGDAVLEIMVRCKVIESGFTNAGKLNELARDFVKATEQSKIIDNIIDLLEEDEMTFFKRGKNAKVNHPKSATAVEYSRATGLEALFAYLYMKGKTERLEYLFETAYNEHINKIINKKGE